MVSGGGHGLQLGDQSAKRLTQADALLGKTGVHPSCSPTNGRRADKKRL